jgi:hypothetical protein
LQGGSCKPSRDLAPKAEAASLKNQPLLSSPVARRGNEAWAGQEAAWHLLGGLGLGLRTQGPDKNLLGTGV